MSKCYIRVHFVPIIQKTKNKDIHNELWSPIVSEKTRNCSSDSIKAKKELLKINKPKIRVFPNNRRAHKFPINSFDVVKTEKKEEKQHFLTNLIVKKYERMSLVPAAGFKVIVRINFSLS
jgi:hypothetical protein